MSTDVRVPTTGNAGEDAVVLEWNVAVGAQVTAGDILVTLETAKATMEVDAPASGVVLKILYNEGDDAPEHGLLAVLGEPGEVVDDAQQAPDAPAAPAVAPAPEAAAPSARTAASPRARVIAERNGIDLASVVGGGPGGRIIVSDVLRLKQETAVSAPVAQAPVPAPVAAAEFTVIPVRGARKVTAQRMQASLQNTAQLTLTRYADAGALLAYAARLRSVAEQGGGPRIGVNDLLLFATARAVVKHPAANSWFDWDGIKQFSAVNLGFAVDTGRALLVPVVRNADTLTLAGVAGAAKGLIERARAGTLTGDEMDGGTFTVSNLGGLGVHWFTPVLNPPQSGILGVGAVHRTSPDTPALLPLSLTFDHRSLDGAAAAALLADIAWAIENVDVLAAY